MIDLKPCPFCGEEAILFHIPKNTEEEIARHPKWAWNYPNTWIVGCNSPLCIGELGGNTLHYMTEEQAAKYWNRRANDDRPRES